MIKRLSGQFNIIGKAALSSLAPSLNRLMLVLLGVIIGMIGVYQILPVKFTDAEPVHLASGYKDQWIKMTAVEFATSGDVQEVTRKIVDAGVTPEMITKLINENQSNTTLVFQLDALRNIAEANRSSASEQAKKIDKGFLDGIFGPILCILGFLVVGVLLSAFFTFYWAVPVGKWAKPKTARGARTGGTVAVSSVSGAVHAERVAATRQAADQKTDFAAVGEIAPVSQHMSSYVLGDDLYDDSFSIETEAGEFLGECGSGISETIGVGDPKKVTATEVWLFDKNDIRTVTKVLMSEHAYNDQALRTKLAPKGEAVMVSPEAITVLETQTLRLRVRVVDVQYGQSALPPRSYFERLTIELAAWPKAGAGGGRPQSIDPSAAFGDTSEILNY